MSHVAKIEIQIKDLGALATAAKALGLEFREGQTSFRWWGTHVGDYPLPEGFTEHDMGVCEHALVQADNPRGYEIGVVKRRDGKPGYTLLWDFFAGGEGLMQKVGEKGEKLVQEYGAAVVTKQYMKQGFKVTRTLGQKGEILLTASK